MSIARNFLLSVIASLLAVHAPLWGADTHDPAGTVQLFNGKNLDAFDTYLREQGLNNDPDKVFRVHDGVIHVSGKKYGYFITKKDYENYHLKVEFKWGEETHAPRKNKPRDSGILFHVVGPNEVWPKSIEFQIIEGRTGEVILVGEGASLTVGGETKTRTRGGGSARFSRYGQGPWKSVLGYRDPVGEVENPHGEWNFLELIADGDRVQYLVNGRVVNEGTRANPSRGRILFQSEGAEVFFRNIELTPVKKQ